MEFVSESEFITALLLIPTFSISLFLILSFLEIFEKYGEILLINKIHTYTNKDLLMPLIIAVCFGLLFYAVYFHLGNYIESLPTQPIRDCGYESECYKKELENISEREKIIKLLTSWLNP